MKGLIFIMATTLLFSCGGGMQGVKQDTADDRDSLSADSSLSAEIPEIDSLIIRKDVLDTNAFRKETQKELKSPGGVEIEILERQPDGLSIRKGDVVKIKYQGKLPDGKVFDSSDMIGMALPYYVGVNMSVKGWDEALLLLQTGDKARVKVPSRLAYGKKGYGKLIPPNTDLLFEMEITEMLKGEKRNSGLQFYKTVEKSGDFIQDGNTVSMHFYGWIFSNGKLFDSSHRNGKAHEFVLGQGKSLPCWDEALKLMRKGEKAFIFSPSELAYGQNGIPELVPANADLVFSIDIVDVK